MKPPIVIVILIALCLSCPGCATLKESTGDTKKDLVKIYYDISYSISHFWRNLKEHTMVIKDLDQARPRRPLKLPKN